MITPEHRELLGRALDLVGHGDAAYDVHLPDAAATPAAVSVEDRPGAQVPLPLGPAPGPPRLRPDILGSYFTWVARVPPRGDRGPRG